MQINEISKLLEFVDEIKFMDWTLKVQDFGDSAKGAAFVTKNRSNFFSVDGKSKDEVIQKLKSEIQAKKSSNAKANNPGIKSADVTKVSGVFNIQVSREIFEGFLPGMCRLSNEEGAVMDFAARALYEDDAEMAELLKSEGFKTIYQRMDLNGERLYQMPITPNQVERLGLEFSGIYTLEKVGEIDDGITRYRLSPEPIDYSSKSEKKIFGVPTFNLATWTKGEAAVNEARDPAIEYEVKEVKGVLDKVTAKVKNQKGSAWTRLGSEIRKIRDQIAVLADQEKKLTDKVKAKFPDAFDAEDEVLTRVVETASMIATLTKASEKEAEKTDNAKIVKEILELDLLPDQQKAILAIIKKNTKISTVKTPSKLRIKTDEGMFSGFLEKIRAWGRNQDQKIAKIKSMISGKGEMINEESVMSSWIDDLTYHHDMTDEGYGDVEMTLGNGRSYTVMNVPIEEFNDWLSADSQGRYWHQYIKGVYTVS